MSLNLDECLAFARNAALQAGHCILKYRKLVLDRVYTSRTHFTTAADEEIDQRLIVAVRERFPDHSVYSEESGWARKQDTSRYTWVCDAVDGTINLASGFTDHVAFCLALCEGGRPILGVVNAVLRGEFYESIDGQGAYCNGQRIEVSQEANIAKVLMGIDSGKYRRAAHLPYLERLYSESGITVCLNTGCASVPLVLVASGVLHAYLATSLAPEDMAAAVAIIRGAGGKVTNLQGEKWTIKDPSIFAANPILHEKLSRFLNIPVL